MLATANAPTVLRGAGLTNIDSPDLKKLLIDVPEKQNGQPVHWVSHFD